VYDTGTKEFSQYQMTTKLRTGAAGGNTMRDHPNGTVWYNAIGNNTIIRFNPTTKEFSAFHPPSGKGAPRNSASPYGMAIAGDGKIWVALNSVDKLGKVDPVTGEIQEFDLPKGSVPRKGFYDANGDIWFGLHGSGKIVKVNHKTNEMTFYEPPTQNSGTYCISTDMKHNIIWVAQQYADMIARFDPKTGVWSEFPLANAEEDHRRIEVDQKNPNRIWWSGNDSNKIGYIEILE
jgi:virginiamycin B lyase